MCCTRRAGGTPQLLLIGTGSELQPAFAAAETLEGEGIPTRVVSLPCWERFDDQDAAYRDEVLPPSVRKRVSVEIGVSLGWERWVGDEGAIVGLDHFGASAPAGTIFEHFGFTADRVEDVARRWSATGCTAGSRPSTAATSGASTPRSGTATRASRAPAVRTRATAETGPATETVALDSGHGHHRRGSGPLARRGLRRPGGGRPGARRDRSRVTRWLRDAAPDATNQRKLESVEFAMARLLQTFHRETAVSWLYGMNAHLGDRRPIDLLADGRVSEVLAAIEAEETGAYA